MSTEDFDRPEPSTAPSPDAATPVPGGDPTGDPADAAKSERADNSPGERPDAATGERPETVPALAVAVDELAQLSGEPVHTHAARYHDVHTLLQDALTDTDR